jgi:3'-phosphoadenosine 5'-phosphosulfate (PAPS) 3'-phosphatase
MRETIERLHTIRPGSELVRAGGAGFKLVEVIEGRADVYLHEGPIRKWDVCAGEALLRAAGGRITDYQGAEHAYAGPPAWWGLDQAESTGGRGEASAAERKKAAKTAFATTGIIASRNPGLVSETLAVAARREEL